MSSKAEKLVAWALYRVVARNMFAGRSLAYEQLLTETAAEVDVLLDKRREDDARLLRRARKQILEDQVRLSAVAESRAAGDQEERDRGIRALNERLDDLAVRLQDLLPPGPPSWHPEHDSNDIV